MVDAENRSQNYGSMVHNANSARPNAEHCSTQQVRAQRVRYVLKSYILLLAKNSNIREKLSLYKQNVCLEKCLID